MYLESSCFQRCLHSTTPWPNCPEHLSRQDIHSGPKPPNSQRTENMPSSKIHSQWLPPPTTPHLWVSTTSQWGLHQLMDVSRDESIKVNLLMIQQHRWLEPKPSTRKLSWGMLHFQTITITRYNLCKSSRVPGKQASGGDRLCGRWAVPGCETNKMAPWQAGDHRALVSYEEVCGREIRVWVWDAVLWEPGGKKKKTSSHKDTVS